MLVHLHVRNLALIEDIEVDFGPGLNILTGETGAGKSILLGSMQLILGQKPSRAMIRENASAGLVELLFQTDNKRTVEALGKLDIEPEDGQILLSRKIMEGRSVSKINGETCTVTQMKAAAAILLDIHGQHEHQSLLYTDRQLEILDAYGGEALLAAKKPVREAYQAYLKAEKARKALDIDEEQRSREMAFLSFEINDIAQAALVPGEDEELEKRYRRLSNSKKIAAGLEEVHEAAGYEGGAGELLGQAVRELSRAAQYDEELAGLQEMLGEADSLLNDFNRELSSYLEDMVFDEETFYETEKRLDLVNNMKARYGNSIPDILEYQKLQQEKLEALEKHAENLELAQKQCARSLRQLEEASETLSKARKDAAEKLSGEIRSGLLDLNFADVRFDIEFMRTGKYSAEGFDEVCYMIAPNPGESMHPLSRTASGGELSRIMLAIKTILADKDQIETLIFDEIDTGISGRTAQKVSEKMSEIGLHRQVLCITHLPQIAAMADEHYEIEKQGDASGTTTHIHRLDEESMVTELARMLGGTEITDVVLENAREMKSLADSWKAAHR